MAVTIVDDTNPFGLKKITFTWVSATDGTASGTTTSKYSGQLIRAIFDPDASSTQPTDQYDVTITDTDGYDVLHGLGANLSNAANVYKTNSDGLGCCLGSTLALAVTNAGEAKGGVVVLYILTVGNA